MTSHFHHTMHTINLHCTWHSQKRLVSDSWHALQQKLASFSLSPARQAEVGEQVNTVLSFSSQWGHLHTTGLWRWCQRLISHVRDTTSSRTHIMTNKLLAVRQSPRLFWEFCMAMFPYVFIVSTSLRSPNLPLLWPLALFVHNYTFD